MTSQEPLVPWCPKCGRTRRILLWALDGSTEARTYRCMDCGGRWQVEGVQEELFQAGAVEVAPLVLEAK